MRDVRPQLWKGDCFCHSGLIPESPTVHEIPASAGMTTMREN